MPNWKDVERAAPELAAAARERFEAHGLGFIATIRRDGSPRISGIEPLFALDELWLGMMPGSRKANDLLADPRFALHNATEDKQVTHGDAKIAGRAVLVEDETTILHFLEAFQARTGYAPPPEPFPLFRADVLEVSTVKPDGDSLAIDWWRHGVGANYVNRR